jgi:ankyrin repeat protein
MLNIKNENDLVGLKNRGADINEIDKFHNTVYHKAVITGNTELVKVLIKHNANPRIRNIKGETPIFYCKKKEILDLLVSTYGPVLYTDMNNDNKNYHSSRR